MLKIGIAELEMLSVPLRRSEVPGGLSVPERGWPVYDGVKPDRPVPPRSVVLDEIVITLVTLE